MLQTKYYYNERAVLMNFSKDYCKSSSEVIASETFERLLSAFLLRYIKDHPQQGGYITEHLGSKPTAAMISLLKKLLVFKPEELEGKEKDMVEKKEEFIKFIEDFYHFWRRLERYTVVNSEHKKSSTSQSFITWNDAFQRLILKTYRKIEEHVMGVNHNVYRQLIVGPNAAVEIAEYKVKGLPAKWAHLNTVPMIKQMVLWPPFITYPRRNKRTGMFQPITNDPIKDISLDPEQYMMLPIKVGKYLCFVYFNIDFISLGLSLMNLFEVAREGEYDKQPDMIYVFGHPNGSQDKTTDYYIDQETKIAVGYANHTEEIDYFGFLKKMILTLSNVKMMIQKQYLPLHASAVNLKLKNLDRDYNIVIIGDSGAGKSESLEGFRVIADDYIDEMTIIYDDMGYFFFDDKSGKLMTSGTETGAFVRVDDLEKGYPYEEIDRCVFMNPQAEVNARMVIPVSTYEQISADYEVDLILYANNYEKGEAIVDIETVEEAINVFRNAKRAAKGTTDEKGIVETYFANMFGPAQHKDICDPLIKEYFDKIYSQGIRVAQIRTQLGIPGMAMEGPRIAGRHLFKQLLEKEGK